MWNKKPAEQYKSIPWLTPMVLTNKGEQHLVGESLKNRKAVFVGFAKDGAVKILLENSSTSHTYASYFWKVI